METFSEVTRRWFQSAFPEPTRVQRLGWPAISSGQHTLLAAPTGSGKTLAAFLWCVDRLVRPRDAPAQRPGIRTVYVSPLKALVYDVDRNLRVPLGGIRLAAEQLGRAMELPRVMVRTGDTTARERREQARDPAEILVTTPESLYLLLGSQARENLRSVTTVIVDEVHALAPTKRGAHLALSLERLSALADEEIVRIGLSATARPLEEVARYLGGDRPVTIVDTSEPPRLDLEVVVPARDMTQPELSVERNGADAAGAPTERGLWPTIYPRLVELIRSHATTLVFVNSRGLCERLSRRLNEVAGENLVRAHHGSLSHDERRHIEEALKEGRLPAIVATSSLELGIDMGAVDLVVLVESPGSVARGLQRVGRAGHGVGQVSRGRLFPKHRGDLLEAAVVVQRMEAGAIESLSVPRNPLDVLAQQIVAAVAVQHWSLEGLRALVRRAASFCDLPDEAFSGVLDMLSGRYPSTAFADLTPRLVWDRHTNQLTARRGAGLVALTNGGTIPDRGTYGVYVGEEGPRVGELDEEMVHETTPGEVFALGATSWRVERVTRDRVLVSPAPGEPGRLPFWRGDGPGRPVELGRALGEFTRKLVALDETAARRWLANHSRLDENAAGNLVRYVAEQREATGEAPTDRDIVVEMFKDELGDLRVCILSPFGARAHAPWAMAIEAELGAEAGFDVQALWSDDGIMLRFAGTDELPDAGVLFPDPDELEERILGRLGESALFAGQFRENAARALLMPRRNPGARTPLWLQRKKSAELLAVARNYPAFPIVIETFRSCLQDVFDVRLTREILRAIQTREIRVHQAETPSASPFARSLVFEYTASYLYDGDAPLAEKRAHALSLDRQLLRELMGEPELRELLDATVLDEVESELQGLADARQARHPDAVVDLLRRVGDLEGHELALRVSGPASEWASELESARRIVRLHIAQSIRWTTVEDVAVYRDALGTAPPSGVPKALLAPVTAPLRMLVSRYARCHGPFRASELAARYGLPLRDAEEVLRLLEADGEVVSGAFRPGGTGTEWCDVEVLRRLKRRTLAKLRHQVAPVDAAALADFLPAWHGVSEPGRGLVRLQEAVAQLEGLPLPYQELQNVILPSRVRDFSPAMLDELGALGWLVWVGHGALGPAGGRVALYRREHVAALLDTPARPADLSPLQDALLDTLAARGASFFAPLQSACGGTAQETLEALQALVWAGLVTNDTLGPLRAMGAPRSRSPRVSARALAKASAGRWALVSELLAAAPGPTERAHARASKLLERHGVVTREVAAVESLPGGFSAIYRVLVAMEEAGRVRRGYFVEGLGGLQFAYASAIERLRRRPPGPEDEAVVVLSAIDPANPFGWSLPWPSRPGSDVKPKRVAGAVVVLVGGELVLYLAQNGRKVFTFPPAQDSARLARALGALPGVASRRRGKSLRVEEIDGEAARASAYAEAFRAAHFTTTYRGLELELSSSGARSPNLLEP